MTNIYYIATDILNFVNYSKRNTKNSKCTQFTLKRHLLHECARARAIQSIQQNFQIEYINDKDGKKSHFSKQRTQLHDYIHMHSMLKHTSHVTVNLLWIVWITEIPKFANFMQTLYILLRLEIFWEKQKLSWVFWKLGPNYFIEKKSS